MAHNLPAAPLALPLRPPLCLPLPPRVPSALPLPLPSPLHLPLLLPKTWKMMTSTCAKTSPYKCLAMRTTSPNPRRRPSSGTSGSCHGQTGAPDKRGPDPGGGEPRMVTADGWGQLACWIASRAKAECRMRVVHVLVGGVVLNSICGGVACSIKML
jgi:hypothetical protein